MIKTLGVFAHIDDETFGMGGTLSKFLEEDTYLLYICQGRGDASDRLRLRAVMGYNATLRVLEYKDMTLDYSDIRNIADSISECINKWGISRVYTNCETDLHQDHSIVSKACKIACRPTRTQVNEFYEVEIPGASNDSFDTHSVLDPSQMDFKKRMLSNYSTELKDNLSPSSVGGLVAVNRANGSLVGEAYVERFKTVFRKI